MIIQGGHGGWLHFCVLLFFFWFFSFPYTFHKSGTKDEDILKTLFANVYFGLEKGVFLAIFKVAIKD